MTDFVGFIVLTGVFRCVVFLRAPSTIRESIEFNTRTLISCEYEKVRGKMVEFESVMREAYHELKIWWDASYSSGQSAHCVKKTTC